jgi:signal transduction histidine kinase
MTRRSLRWRLAAAAAAVITAGMAIAAGLLLWRMHSVLAADLDNSLVQQAHSAARDVAAGTASSLRVSRTAPASTALQVVDVAGRVLASAGDVDGADRMFYAASGVGEPALNTVDGAALEGPYRVAALAVPTASGVVTLYLGAPTTPLVTIRNELGSSLAVGIPVAIAALTVISWWLIGRALRPVETMRRQAAAIPGHDADGRLDVPAARDELGRLAETFNDLLGRIAAASDGQRRFVDDAAHELRSPLATLRTQLEVSGDHRADALRQVSRLSDLVDDLLVIARLDSGAVSRRHPVDLDDVVWQIVGSARRDGPPEIDTTGVSPVRVIGDDAGLRRMVRNLVENARRHATGRVVVQLTASRVGTATLTIADDGPGIPPADRLRVFDRFVRLDAGRARDDGGTGLGLAIVASVVDAHGGRVWIEDAGAGTAIVVRLPAVATDE